MDARPLRELLADLVGDPQVRQAYGSDPAGYLAAHGHPDLPEPLVAEAVVSYADTAPVEVASALSPYVAAHGPIPGEDTSADWFDLLTSADLPADEPFDEQPTADTDDWPDPEDLDFGTGASSDEATTPDVAEDSPAEDIDSAPDEAPDWTPETHLAPEPVIEGLPDDVDDDDPLD